jgi:hypothetical protein
VRELLEAVAGKDRTGLESWVVKTCDGLAHVDGLVTQLERWAEIVKLRKRYLLVAAVLGVAVALVPALAVAGTSEAKLEVNENCVEPEWPCWTSPVGSPEPAFKTTIASGGTVMFVDHGEKANIAWIGAAPTCEPSVPVAPASPGTGWEGKCMFATPGAYKFESSTLFNEPGLDYTKYEIVVEGSAAAPPTGTTGEGGSKGGSTPGTTPSGPAPAGEKPAGSPLAGAPRIGSNQRGSTVKGSVEVSKAGAGDRLEVELFATTASLAKAGHSTQVVGRFVSASVSAGQRSFSVKPNARARRALKRRHRLALKVKITLTSVNGGEAASVSRSVTLHA